MPEAIQEIADITDRKLLEIRIILGCLFAFLVGLPLSNLGLQKMQNLLFGSADWNPSDFALIAVPFLVGFSTNLVLAILDRCVISIRTFFGISEGNGVERKTGPARL